MDIASPDLNAVPLPIPSEMRVYVFLASGADLEMESAFLKWGGFSEFITDPARAEKCGICIFRRGFGAVSAIKPFLDRAGKEANVFAFDWQDKTFRRVNENWVEIYSTVISV